VTRFVAPAPALAVSPTTFGVGPRSTPTPLGYKVPPGGDTVAALAAAMLPAVTGRVMSAMRRAVVATLPLPSDDLKRDDLKVAM
jgi:hypothetical protein